MISSAAENVARISLTSKISEKHFAAIEQQKTSKENDRKESRWSGVVGPRLEPAYKNWKVRPRCSSWCHPWYISGDSVEQKELCWLHLCGHFLRERYCRYLEGQQQLQFNCCKRVWHPRSAHTTDVCHFKSFKKNSWRRERRLATEGPHAESITCPYAKRVRTSS